MKNFNKTQDYGVAVFILLSTIVLGFWLGVCISKSIWCISSFIIGIAWYDFYKDIFKYFEIF